MNQAQIIRKPQITEKAHIATSDNWYTFVVNPKANKHQIKYVIENQYNVEVVAVRTLTSPVKTKRTGKKRLIRNITATKKTMVQLKKGQSIHLFESPEQ